MTEWKFKDDRLLQSLIKLSEIGCRKEQGPRGLNERSGRLFRIVSVGLLAHYLCMQIIETQIEQHFQFSQSKSSEYAYIHRLLSVQDHLVSEMKTTEDIFIHQEMEQLVNKLDDCIQFLSQR